MKPRSAKPRDVARLLGRHGFIEEPTKATAHRVYRHPDGRKTTVSWHSGDLPTGTLRKIIGQMGLTVAEFNEQL